MKIDRLVLHSELDQIRFKKKKNEIGLTYELRMLQIFRFMHRCWSIIKTTTVKPNIHKSNRSKMKIPKSWRKEVISSQRTNKIQWIIIARTQHTHMYVNLIWLSSWPNIDSVCAHQVCRSLGCAVLCGGLLFLFSWFSSVPIMLHYMDSNGDFLYVCVHARVTVLCAVHMLLSLCSAYANIITVRNEFDCF